MRGFHQPLFVSLGSAKTLTRASGALMLQEPNDVDYWV